MIPQNANNDILILLLRCILYFRKIVYSFLGNAAYPAVNTGPYSTNQADFQAFIQEQLRQLEAQQEAFRAQIEAQRQM